MADGITDSHNQDSSELEVPMTSTNELETNIINRDNNLIEEIASLTAILDNNNKEIEEFQKQIFEMRKK
ncbi:hypothetical protein ACWM35_18040 [Neobacillus sp. K501]